MKTETKKDEIITSKEVKAYFKTKFGVVSKFISIKNLDIILGKGNSSIKINTGVS